MFHTYRFESSAFQDWLRASDQLYLQRYLELGGKQKDYQPLQTDAQSGDQYMLYVDDVGGICGSAVVTSMSYSFDIDDEFIPSGTWVLRNVLFHIRAGHPVQDQPETFSRIAKMFHFTLFDQLWHIAKASSHKIALSLQTDREAHEDLKDFGGFTFDSEVVFDEDDRSLSMGIIALTAQTYRAYQQQKEESFNFKDVKQYIFQPLRQENWIQTEASLWKFSM